MEKKICLNGLWDFSAKSDKVSVLPDAWEEEQIKVPSPYNINSFAGPREKNIRGDAYRVYGGDFRLYPEYPEGWESLTCGFYRRKVFVPLESVGKRLFLRFDGLSYHSAVYVNGRLAVEDMEGFLPVETEITSLVRFGEANEITVGAEKAKNLIYKDDAGRNRLDYPIGSFWGEHIGGIWQDVWLIERPETYVADVFAVTDAANGRLTLRYELSGEVDVCSDRVEAMLTDGEGRERRIVSDVPATGNGSLRWEYGEGEVELWEPESPALYTLTVRLVRKGTVFSENSTRIGFRTFTAGEDCFYLNGRPIKLVADAWHYMGYSVQTPEYARSYYRMAKEAGVNIIRLHAQPWPEFFYDIADEMGMLLICESAIWASHCNFSYGDFFFENCKKHLRRLILRDRNHPSIVLWSPENECVPAYHVCGSRYIKTTEELEDKIYDLILEIPTLDPSRLISCDGSGDLKGRLPVHSIHYPGYECPAPKGKPITIGEMGSMYYSTPDTLCLEHGEAPLRSMKERLKAVAADAYHNLMGERRWAAQICVFNLIWYGLQPYPFQERLLEYRDQMQPGIKPSRITPYLRTLNAGMEPEGPEFYPNPVYEMAKRAYAPVRFYLENLPESLWKGERLSRRLYLFHDRREEGRYLLKALWQEKMGERTLLWKELSLSPCSVEELVLSIPETDCLGKACLSVTLEELESAKTVWEEWRELEIYEKEALLPQAEVFQKEVIFYDSGEEAGKLPALFRPGEEIRFREPVPYRILPYEWYRNGSPLYFDGEGNVVIALSKPGCGRLLSGVDLCRIPGTEGIRLAASLAGTEGIRLAASPEETERPKEEVLSGCVYLCEEEDGSLEESLRLAGCHFIKVTDPKEAETYSQCGTRETGALLILGRGRTHLQCAPEMQAFSRILIDVGTSGETGLPGVAWEPGKIYHLVASEETEAKLGIYGLSLYGLERDREQALAEGTMRDTTGELEKLIYLPRIDWRMWNNDPEEIKTVSAYRSEQEEKSSLCVLGRKCLPGREIYYSALGTDPGIPKQRYLWERLLASFGIPLGETSEEASGEAGDQKGDSGDGVPEYMMNVLY